jgi:hypothetical protein
LRRERLQSVLLPSVRTIGFLYAIAGVGAGAISLLFGQSQNFHVFTDAAWALVRGEDLYVLRSADYYKYSPTFAVLFLPFASVPAWIGASLWSLTNFAVAFAGIGRAVQDDTERRLALLVAFVGILLCTDGDQSNLLVGGATLLALDAFERGHTSAGSSLIAGAGLIKIFPFGAIAFALFSSRRWRSIVGLAIATIFLAALPALACGPRTLLSEYASWKALLTRDSGNHGWSVMTVVQDTLRWRWPSAYLQVGAALVQAAPLAFAGRSAADVSWRRTFACSLLCFFVLFNHRTEYASFVLSAMGTAIWWATTPASPTKTALAVLVLLAPGPFFAWSDPSVTGFFSFVAAHRMFHPLRVLPLLFAWAWMMMGLWQRLGLLKGRTLEKPEMTDAHAR